ncbi:MAG: hypothetical protein ACI31A_05430 [Candidatus Limisoma sp.]
MKKFCLLLVLLLGAGLSVNAESTVRLFVGPMLNAQVRLCIDGEEVCDMIGKVDDNATILPKFLLSKRVLKDLGFTQIAPCFRTIKVKKEGNVTFTIVHEDPKSENNAKPYECDKSLNLKDGETYNLQFVISRKDVFRIPKDKDVEKWTKEWEELPTVTYPKEK